MSVATLDTGGEAMNAEEWRVRVDLAACYRLVALFGWDDLVFTHISARVPGTEPHFLINPYGLLFEEITASSLVKVDLAGRKVSASGYEINPAGFTIHSAVHEARADAHCVLHLHTTAGVAIAAQAAGLLPISQQAIIAQMGLAYHDYEGIALSADEKTRLVADLGRARCMILRNHGLLTCGPTVADAFLGMYVLQRACEVQVAAQAGGAALITVAPAILQGMMAALRTVTLESGAALAWPGLIRRLDRENPGYAA